MLTRLCCLLCSQGVALQSAEAVSVQLGGLDGPPQAQLDGFTSRALRSAPAPSQRHLYLTEWRSLDVAEARGGATLVIGDAALAAECERLSSRVSRHELAPTVGGGAWAVIAAVVATQRGSHARPSLFALEVALAIMQTQASTMPNVWLLGTGSPAHQGLWGLARSARAEASLPVHCIDGETIAALDQLSTAEEPEAALRPDAFLVPRLARARRL